MGATQVNAKILMDRIYIYESLLNRNKIDLKPKVIGGIMGVTYHNVKIESR